MFQLYWVAKFYRKRKDRYKINLWLAVGFLGKKLETPHTILSPLLLSTSFAAMARVTASTCHKSKAHKQFDKKSL